MNSAMDNMERIAAFRDRMAQFLPAGEAERITHAVAYGKGSWYWDFNGKKYLDFSSGIFTNSFGHGDPDLAQALFQSFSGLGNIHGRHWAGELAVFEKLFARLPSDDYRVIAYGDGGGYAVDRAEVELYYHFDKKPYRLVTFNGGFHGKTQGTKLSISHTQDSAFFYSETAPEPNCFRCPCHRERMSCSMECASLLEEKMERFKADVFLFEPILGAGIVTPPEGFWPRIERFCRRHGILMVADEVLTGGGRTGEFFASVKFGICPDILILTKGLANGLPLSLLFLKKSLTENIRARREGNYSATYSFPPALLAVLGTLLDKLDKERVMENVRERGKELLQGLCRLKSKFPVIGDARGCGLMAALEFTSPDGAPAPDVGRAVFDTTERNGLTLIHSGHILRIAPPLNVSALDIHAGLTLLEKSILEAVLWKSNFIAADFT